MPKYRNLGKKIIQITIYFNIKGWQIINFIAILDNNHSTILVYFIHMCMNLLCRNCLSQLN